MPRGRAGPVRAWGEGKPCRSASPGSWKSSGPPAGLGSEKLRGENAASTALRGESEF